METTTTSETLAARRRIYGCYLIDSLGAFAILFSLSMGTSHASAGGSDEECEWTVILRVVLGITLVGGIWMIGCLKNRSQRNC